jgi:hypothetical protein
MDDIGLNCFPEGEISYCQKHRNDYFRKFNKYISSDENEEKTISLLKKYQQDVKGPAFQVLTAVMFNLERSFFTELSTYLELSAPEPFQKLPENIDSAGNEIVISMLLTITYLPFWKTIKSYIIHNRRLTLEPIIIQFIIFQNGIFKCYNFVLHSNILNRFFLF